MLLGSALQISVGNRLGKISAQPHKKSYINNIIKLYMHLVTQILLVFWNRVSLTVINV